MTGEVALRREDGGVVTVNPFKADPKYLDFPKDRLVQVVLGSHEYLLTAIEAWAGDAVMRYGLDAMFAFQSLPGVGLGARQWENPVCACD